MKSLLPSSTSLRGQLASLGRQATELRDQLQKVKSRDLPPTAVESLGTLAETLENVGSRLDALEDEHRNLAALADIGSVVNSSLELDEVLRIVIDRKSVV